MTYVFICPRSHDLPPHPQVVDEAIQLEGGTALVTSHPLERAYRRVRAWRLTEGANDLLRMQLSQHASGALAPRARI
eukprot:COSAG01_NODE_32639_length_578_cov_0.653445_1_plen_77_part_00